MPRNRAYSTQRGNAEETRHAILSAAQDLFAESGYRAVTTRMVADASGVKQPLLYYHFADKEALYLEVQREQAKARTVALERIAARQSESVPERLKHVVSYLRRSRRQNMGMFFHELRHEMSPPTRTAMREIFHSSIVVPLMSIFEDGIRTSFLRAPVDGGVAPRLAVYLLLCAISSLPTQLDTQSEVVTDSLWWGEGHNPVDEIVDALIYGMITRSHFESSHSK